MMRRHQPLQRQTGLGVVLAPAPFARVYALAPVRFAEALEPAAAEWPTDDLWLVGHRALREVPRVAAVWSFLLEELGSIGGGTGKALRGSARS